MTITPHAEAVQHYAVRRGGWKTRAMNASDEHRVAIDPYLQWARETRTGSERRLFLGMARTFLRKLTFCDRSLPRLPKAQTLSEDCLVNGAGGDGLISTPVEGILLRPVELSSLKNP